MSDTTYVHEITKGTGVVRVTLTMDADEARALADVASAAIDGTVYLPEQYGEDSPVFSNASNIYRWATKAANTLDYTAGLRSDKE